MAQSFDLLGDPIPDGRGKPGATGHIATAENTNKVRWLLVSNAKKPEIAKQLGISIPTLNKHYFKKQSLKAARLRAISEAQSRMLLLLDRAAEKGSVSAMKEIGKIARQAELDCLASDIRKPLPSAKPLGIKAQRKAEATPDGSWDFLSGPRPEGVH